MLSRCGPKVSEVPPEITAQCQDRGVVFSVAGSSEAQSLWEVGVDQEPLTRDLAVQRGYLLSVHNQKTLLEIPLFSIGYTYEVRDRGGPWWTVVDHPWRSRSRQRSMVSSLIRVFQDINLSNFYGTFQLLLRDSKSLKVQTSTSKRCLFQTQDMMGMLRSRLELLCSSDLLG